MRRFALPLVLAAAALAALPAGATTARDLLIRPGVGIGKVRLGMTPAQLRAAMGKPLAVLPLDSPFGRRAVEWQYGYGAYTVRLEGRGSALRVAAVTTTVRAERTAQGFGVGTLESRLERVFGARLRCERLRTGKFDPRGDLIVVLDRNRDCVVRHEDGRETVFVTWVKPVETYDGIATPERWEREAQVLEVAVRSS